MSLGLQNNPCHNGSNHDPLNTGSNRLPELASQICKAHADVQEAEKTVAIRALDAGAALVEAKALCRHGEWAAWLQAAGVPERSARRYMQLSRAGFISATVADLGLVEAERLAASGLNLLPRDGEAICFRAYDEDGLTSSKLSFWWRDGDAIARYWTAEFVSEHEALYLNRRIPVWLLGAMEGKPLERDHSNTQTVAVAEAQRFIAKFEAGGLE